MSLFGDDQGRTEKPTPGRLAEVRNRGDTQMSRELLTGVSLLAAALVLRSFGGWLIDALSASLRHGLDVDLKQHAIGAADVPAACREVLASVSFVVAPLLLVLAILVLAIAIAGYGQIGLRFANEVVRFDLSRINPANNFKRLLNLQSLVRTGFAAAKLAVLGGVLALVLRGRWAEIAHICELPLIAAFGVVADLALTVLFWVAAIVFALAAADVAWQRFDFTKRNMMTKQEVEDERRRSEGDPLIKSRLQRARLELMRHRMMEAVAKADVVIVNPTHYSVALRYDKKRNAAPEVVAKGVDAMALRIRELARENRVPLLEDPPLARALFAAVRIGQEIPARFYEAVATVLGHVYRLKNRVA